MVWTPRDSPMPKMEDRVEEGEFFNENEAEEYETDSGEEEEWWHPEVKQGEKVQVVEEHFKIWLHITSMFSGIFHPEREDHR